MAGKEDLKGLFEYVKERADIVQVVQRFVPLKSKNRDFVGLCPWHDDNKPSMNVSPERKSWRCWVCNIGGDAVSFVSRYEKISQFEALKSVASQCSIEIPSHFNLQEAKKGREQSEVILQAYSKANAFFQRNLTSNSQAWEYLKQRGVTPETIRRFQIGYAPKGWSNLKSHLASEGIDLLSSIQAGLVVEKEEGKSYDRFRNRIVFPIWNMSGHVIAFGARVLDPEENPKYLNSPESQLYQKSEILYGFHFARRSIEKSGTVLLVEGYMDVIGLWQAGITNAVSVSGVALTEKHVALLKRFCRKAILLFDGDTAGRRAARRSIEPLIAAGIEVTIPRLPQEHDPDSFARKYGKEEAEKLFANGDDLVEFLTIPFQGNEDTFSPEAKERLLVECMQVLAKIESEMVRQTYLEALRRKLEFTAIPQVNHRKVVPASTYPSATPSPTPIPATPSPERDLLLLMLSSRELCILAMNRLDLAWIQSKPLQKMTDELLAFVEETEDLDLVRFTERLTAEEKNWMEQFQLIETVDFHGLKKRFSDTLFALERRYVARVSSREDDLERQNELLRLKRTRFGRPKKEG